MLIMSEGYDQFNYTSCDLSYNYEHNRLLGGIPHRSKFTCTLL